jgi:hypothetical protein
MSTTQQQPPLGRWGKPYVKRLHSDLEEGSYGPVHGVPAPQPGTPASREPAGGDMMVATEKRVYGGVKVGSAFFGWLAATGMMVLLAALVTVSGAAALGTTGADDAGLASETLQSRDTMGWAGAIALLVVVFAAYYCGGYVAGRMARFNGVTQGVAVWLWGVVIGSVAAAVAAIVGPDYNLPPEFDGVLRTPVPETDITTAGVIAVLVLAACSLFGAVLGGLAGMRFHRRVDRSVRRVSRSLGVADRQRRTGS